MAADVSRRATRPPAVVFDVDGVLVASPHERAWRDALADLMATAWHDVPSAWAPERFTTAVYQEVLAGRPRIAGARAALEYFGVPDAERRAEVYAERKQRRIEALIAAGEFVAFPDGLRLVLALAARGLRLAAASSSRNADRFMDGIRLDDFAGDDGIGVPSRAPGGETLRDAFAANVCGAPVPRGKPHPDLFLLAAEELGVPPARCIVVEDAPAGVQAARAAGMAAIGIARLGDEALLAAAGADAVVGCFDEIAVDALAAGRLEVVSRPAVAVPGGAFDGGPLARWLGEVLAPTPDPAWLLREDGYVPLREAGIESRFTVSNGFLGVRGSRAISRGAMWMSFLHTMTWASWPRTFVAGLFDTPNTEPPVPALVPAPDWLRLRITLDDDPLVIRSGDLLGHVRTLDLRRGVLVAEWRQRDPRGRVIRVRALRLVSLADRALGAQLVQL
jgi:beta-phosphoglucomutase-like phosphatase (HAD superfamily)